MSTTKYILTKCLSRIRILPAHPPETVKRILFSAVVSICALTFLGQLHAHQEILHLGDPTPITSTELTEPFDLAVTASGSVIVVEFRINRLTKVALDGDVVWRIGGTGRDPGQFQTLYRVAVAPDQSVLAFDIATQEVSWFDRDGRFLQRRRLPTMMAAVSDIVALDDGLFAVSGVARNVGLNSIRLYDKEAQQLRAFGLLPAVQNKSVLEHWGAGGLHRTADGNLLFTRKIPYEFYRYSLTGELLEQTVGEHRFDRGPDDSVVEVSSAAGVQVGRSDDLVPFPWPAKALGDGWILGGVYLEAQRINWQVYKNGAHKQTLAPPASWGPPPVVSEVDRNRRFLYVKLALGGTEETYFRVPYELREERP